MVEIRTDFQTDLHRSVGPARRIDVRYTAPLTDTAKSSPAASYDSKKLKSGESSKQQKQSILLSQSKKKFKDRSERLLETSENARQVGSRVQEPFESQGLFGPEMQAESWNNKLEIFKKTTSSDESGQISSNVLKKPQNSGPEGAYEVQPIAREHLESSMDDYSQVEQQNEFRGLGEKRKTVLTIHNIDRGGDDSDLLIKNLDATYEDLLTPKPSIWSDAVQFIDKMSKRVDFRNQKQSYSGSHLEYPPDSVRFNPENKIMFPPDPYMRPVSNSAAAYQIPKVSNRVLIPLQQPSYEQNRIGINSLPVFDVQKNDLTAIAPIVPVNSIFGNSMNFGLPDLNNPLLPSPTVIGNTLPVINKLSEIPRFLSPTQPFNSGIGGATISTIPISTAAPVPKFDQFFKKFSLFNGVPSLSTSTPNYQRVGAGNAYNWQSEKELTIRSDKEYPSYAQLKKRLVLKSLIS